MNIRLEYSASTGAFHFATINEAGANKFTYGILAASIQSDKALRFCALMELKFPVLTDPVEGKQKLFPTFLEIRNEYLNFIYEETNAIARSMIATFKRRSTLFNK